MADLKRLGVVSSWIAFVLCLAGGLWILANVGFRKGDDGAVWTGIGLYFLGKAFFVGPLLRLTASQKAD